MWTKTYSKVFQGINREDIWRVWTDVNSWPKWQNDLDDCKMEGSFSVGNHFLLKPKGVKAVKIVLTKIEEGRGFTDCTKFPLAKMYDNHEMEETPQGLKLTHTLVVTGPLQWLWVKLVAKNVADTVPAQVEALVNFARSLRS